MKLLKSILSSFLIMAVSSLCVCAASLDKYQKLPPPSQFYQSPPPNAYQQNIIRQEPQVFKDFRDYINGLGNDRLIELSVIYRDRMIAADRNNANDEKYYYFQLYSILYQELRQRGVR